jgi:DNA-binding MarR family transcriptional regulator
LTPERVWLSLVRAHEYGNARLTSLFREYGLTPAQYNVLRILRGAGEGGLNCTEIAARMLTRDPDITRLADRMAKRGLIGRRRSLQDRRAVVLALEPPGKKLLDALEAPLAAALADIFAPLSTNEAAELGKLLDRVSSATR